MTDFPKILEYIQKNGFGTLVSFAEHRPLATHIPMFVEQKEENIYLYGHIARANGQKEAFDQKQNLLAIFMADHAYISSSWYDHINVPTWNYIAVHLYGTAREITGEELTESIDRLVDQYEVGRENRFYVHQMSDQERRAHYRGLVAFVMQVTEIHASEKLSQNRNDSDYCHIIDQLRKSDVASQNTADAMYKLRLKE